MLFLLTAVFVVSAGAPARDTKSSRVDTSLCSALLSALQVHDNEYAEVRLPQVINFDYKRSDFEKFYALNLALWSSDNYLTHLKSFVEKLRDGRSLTSDEDLDLKMIRARLKQIRFAYAAFSSGHSYPPLTHKMTVKIGHLQDALKNGRQDLVKENADKIIALLTKSKKIQRELEDFQASSGSSFLTSIREEMDFMDRGIKKLESGQITAKDFHNMRKVISRLVSVFDTINTIQPSTHTDMVVKYLSTLNGIMGREHNRLIFEAFNNKLDYEGENVHINVPALVPLLRNLTATIRRSLDVARS